MNLDAVRLAICKLKVKDEMKPIQKKQSGQSLVELAISLMIILMLLLGAVEISLALFQYVTIRDAAQEGAVYGSIKPEDEAGIQFRAAAAASDVLNIDPTAVEVKINDKSVTDAIASNEACEGIPSGGTAPNSLTVTIIFDHHIAFPLVEPMIGTDTTRLTATVTNTILRPICP